MSVSVTRTATEVLVEVVNGVIDQTARSAASAAQATANAALPKAGGTMTGNIVLAGAPTLSLHPASKAYVDGSNLTGKTLWIDGTNGNDSTATSGRIDLPYLTLAAAKAAANAGDLIHVRPGSYSVTATILKNGVNWHFEAGATVTRTTAVDSGIIDDDGSAMTCNVSGEGVFVLTLAQCIDYTACVRSRHANSVITVHARRIGVTQGVAQVGVPMGVYGQNGTLFVECSESIYAQDQSALATGIAVYWYNGDMFVRAPHIWADHVAVYPHGAAVTVGDMFVSADLIETISEAGTDQPGTIFDFSEDPTAATWIEAKIIKSPGNAIAAVQHGLANFGGKLYVRSQKIFGRIESNSDSSSALLYVDADKIDAVGNGTSGRPALVYQRGSAKTRIDCRHWNPLSYTGESIKVAGGTLFLRNGDLLGGSSLKGVEVSGGTLHAVSLAVDTSANSSANALSVSGGTANINEARLRAHSSGKDIAQTGGTVTVTGGSGSGTNGNYTTSGTVGLTYQGVLPPDNGGTGVANNAAATLTRSGNHALTLTTTGTTSLTLPTTGTLVTTGTTVDLNINGTVGATTPSTGAFTTIKASQGIVAQGGTPAYTGGGLSLQYFGGVAHLWAASTDLTDADIPLVIGASSVLYQVSGTVQLSPVGALTINPTAASTINNCSIGATTPSTGAFTTLSASSTVSGTGFSTYLASPPAIGGTAAAAGAFTTLTATSLKTSTGIVAQGAAPSYTGGGLSLQYTGGNAYLYASSTDIVAADLPLVIGAGSIIFEVYGNILLDPVGALTINPTAASTINNCSIGATTPSTGAFTTLKITSLPTSDPGVAGQVWNNGGVLMISAG